MIPKEMDDWTDLEEFSIASNPVFDKGLPTRLKKKAIRSRREFRIYAIFALLVVLGGLALIEWLFISIF